jgi:hypothetical protein
MYTFMLHKLSQQNIRLLKHLKSHTLPTIHQLIKTQLSLILPPTQYSDVNRSTSSNSWSLRTRRKFCSSAFLYCQVLVMEQYLISYYQGYQNVELELKNWSHRPLQRHNRKHNNMQLVFIVLWTCMRALMSAFEPAGEWHMNAWTAFWLELPIILLLQTNICLVYDIITHVS